MILTSEYNRIRIEWLIPVIQTLLLRNAERMRAGLQDFYDNCLTVAQRRMLIEARRAEHWREN